jgi:hypothetical protein
LLDRLAARLLDPAAGTVKSAGAVVAGVRRRVLLVVAVFLLAGCAGTGGENNRPSAIELLPGPDHRAFAGAGREFDLVADRDDPAHLSLAFITPRDDAASPSWLVYATSRDGGETWEIRPLCGDPLAVAAPDPACPFLGARLTSDPVLLQLDDGSFLYVGVALRADSVLQFAARFPRGAMEPESVHTVSRSAFSFFPGAQMLPAPYQVYYNGKANVMQASDGSIHLVWAADFGAENDAGPQVTTGIPHLTTSVDGGRTWSTPLKLAPETFADVGGLYAVGVELFETLDGHLHAVWWDGYTNALYQVDSDDGARRFTAPRHIGEVLARPADARADSDNVTRLWTGVDRSAGPWRGSVYLLADDKSTGDRDLVLFTSRDGAGTWAEQRLPTDTGDGRDETMARLLVEPGGAISILYPSWDKVERLAPSDMHLARSVDGGATWASVRLSSDVNPHPNPGDYNDLDVADGGLVAVWEDARDGTRGPWMSRIATHPHARVGRATEEPPDSETMPQT